MSNTFPNFTHCTPNKPLHGLRKKRINGLSPSAHQTTVLFSKDISPICARCETSKKTVLKRIFTIGFYTPVGGKSDFLCTATPTQTSSAVKKPREREPPKLPRRTRSPSRACVSFAVVAAVAHSVQVQALGTAMLLRVLGSLCSFVGPPFNPFIRVGLVWFCSLLLFKRCHLTAVNSASQTRG